MERSDVGVVEVEEEVVMVVEVLTEPFMVFVTVVVVATLRRLCTSCDMLTR